MKVYIVYSLFHYDDYKRADSSVDILKVFTDEDRAYNYAINKLLLMFEEFAIYSTYEEDSYKDNLFSKFHILSVINDENRTKEDIYNWIQFNLYDNILEEPEFTMMPTHINYLVTSKIIDNDDDE